MVSLKLNLGENLREILFMLGIQDNIYISFHPGCPPSVNCGAFKFDCNVGMIVGQPFC